MASSTSDLEHKQHIARLKTMGSRNTMNILARRASSGEGKPSSEQVAEEEDPEEVAYRERLRTLASVDEDNDADPMRNERRSDLSKKDRAASADRARNAMSRTLSGTSDLDWIAGQGKKLLLHSLSSVSSVDSDYDE